MVIKIEKDKDIPIYSLAILSKTNDDELIEDLIKISLIHGRNFFGSVSNTPHFRSHTGQYPIYVHEAEMPKNKSYEIDVKKLRQIIENFNDALILTYRNETRGFNYFLPPVAQLKDGTIDTYIRLDSFIPDFNMINEPEWFDEKRYLELSDIMKSSA